MIESSQKPNESFQAFIGADPKLLTEECIRDEYQELMNGYFDSFGANKRSSQASNQFNSLSAPGYFNNGVADVTAKSVE